MIGNIIGIKTRRKLGEGGMGDVYKGVDMMLEAPVRDQALRPELAARPRSSNDSSEAVTSPS